MPPRRRLPANAEIAVRAHMEPVLLKGGETVKSLSTAFLADLEEDWRQHGKEILPGWSSERLQYEDPNRGAERAYSAISWTGPLQAHSAVNFGQELADGDVACDRDDAQLLPEFILKRYCRVVLADAHMAHIWGLQSFGHGQSIAEYDMRPRRRLPANAEIAVRAHMEPVLLMTLPRVALAIEEKDAWSRSAYPRVALAIEERALRLPTQPTPPMRRPIKGGRTA